MTTCNCKICNSKSDFLFEGVVLNKHLINYFRCTSCGFIQTENPFWLEEAYSDAIASIDVGLIDRNLKLSNIFESIIDNNFNTKSKFLDYAGGYGLFVRLMRDKGLNFWWYDKYCKNIFSNDFSYSEINDQFECITAIEVFEHLEDPELFLEGLLENTDSVLFTTLLIPDTKLNSTDDWWYFTTLTGQHISFFTIDSLKVLAQKFNLNYYTDSQNIHLFTKKQFIKNPLEKKKARLAEKILRKITKSKLKKKTSLIEHDYQLAANKILYTTKMNVENENIV